MQTFEKVLASVASQCEYNYGAMGRVGYLYESVKDQLRWHNLPVKQYVKLISTIGQIMAYDKDTFKKEKAKSIKIKSNDIESVLKKVFMDGKK